MGDRSFTSPLTRAQKQCTNMLLHFALCCALVAVAHAIPFENVGCIDFHVHSTSANISKTYRGGGDDKDPGYGVDMDFSKGTDEQLVHTTITDTDGDGFFQVQMGAAYCKVDSGSNGLDPGPSAEVFEMSGLQCMMKTSANQPNGCFQIGIFLNQTHDSDCVTPESHRAPKG